MKTILLMGRVLFSALFIFTSFSSIMGHTADHAASAGVPDPSLLVPLAGIIELLGGLSILLGYKVRWGALLILLFLIPVTFYMHAFWKIDDPMQQQMQKASFMSNLALMGTALMLMWFGAGPSSVDNMTHKSNLHGQKLSASSIV
jgi:putative oxidoreductase